MQIKWMSILKPMAGLVLAMGFAGPATAQVDSSVMTDLVLQIQQLQDEVRQLRGMVEAQAHEIESLKQRQREQYLDLDGRMQELASAPHAAHGQPDARSEQPVDSDTGSMVADAGPDSTTAAQEPLDAAAVIGDQQAYQQAFRALKELRYADAAEGFYAFLGAYPDSEYADNAQYWLGEAYYATKNFDLALEAFTKLVEAYSESSKVPDALLKIGYSHYELKQWSEARQALLLVKNNFPDTSLARLADSRLRSMRVEGHF